MNYRKRGRIRRDPWGGAVGRYLGASAIIDNPEYALDAYGLGNPMVGEAIRLGGITDLCVQCGGSGRRLRKGGVRHVVCYECAGKGRRPQFEPTVRDAPDAASLDLAKRLRLL